MIIKVSNDLKKEEIWANGNELANIMGKDRVKGKRVLNFPQENKLYVHTFDNPILMTDNYRIAKLNPTKRDTIFALFTSRPRIVEYDKVSVIWNREHASVWCPSIDTILFAKALKKLSKKLNKVKTVLEIGTGSGFLSKYLLVKNKNIKSIVINDLNPYAVDCAKLNIKDKRAKFVVGDGLKFAEDKKFDLVICNPPYVPRADSIDDNPYEGIELLNNLIHEGQKYLNEGGMLITNISSLCYRLVLKEKTKMKMKVIERMSVPLKVNNILNNKSWVDYLEKNCLKKKYKDGYEYWQDLNIVLLEN
jgi:tRNA1(Val) A37 N6-methylase TrmN6